MRTGQRLLLVLLLLAYQKIAAQVVNPYFMNGSATQENCNCYTLTPDVIAQSGSVWNVNKISLLNSFDYKFDVFLGCEDGGADGIVFVLQPISVSVGTSGGGLGYENVTPSIGVAIDTWQNTINSDPFEDHIAIHRNGDINHNTGSNLAGPVSALANGGNIEDCKFHSLHIRWDAVSKKLSAQVDGVDRVEATIDLVKDVFGNDPMVFWGFTASTGGAKNLQRFCTSLNASFGLPANQQTCFPVTLAFSDSSSSFGEIVKWEWDLGDGTKTNLKVPLPHTYAAPGNYDVKLNIVGNNGCTSDTFKQRIVIGSKPIADFNIDPGIVCDSFPVFFRDVSTVQFGTINNWNWSVRGSPSTTRSPGPLLFQTTGPGTASLRIQTREGCISDPISKSFEVLKRPDITYTIDDVCVGEPARFIATNINSSVSIAGWNWNFGDGAGLNTTTPLVDRIYNNGGPYKTSLSATAVNGCNSYTLEDTIRVYQTRANAGVDTILATGQTYTLRGSGGEIYRWSPSTGLSDPNIANPVFTPAHDMSFTLTATTSFGCPTTDIVNIKVYDGPEVYVPNAFTPNGDGKNDRFRPLAVGINEVQYFQVYNRYGQLIFSSKDTYLGWDGTSNGKPVPLGTYVWRIAGIDFSGKQHVKKGTVTLIR